MKNWHLWCSFWTPPEGAVASFPQLPDRPQVSKDPDRWQGPSAVLLKVPLSSADWSPQGLPPSVMSFQGAQARGKGPLSSLKLQAPHRDSLSLLGCPAFG